MLKNRSFLGGFVSYDKKRTSNSSLRSLFLLICAYKFLSSYLGGLFGFHRSGMNFISVELNDGNSTSNFPRPQIRIIPEGYSQSVRKPTIGYFCSRPVKSQQMSSG